MKRSVSFYLCEKCGNIVELIKNGGGQLVCCGLPMVKMIENTVDASYEKHLPVGRVENGNLVVQVGSDPHPMSEQHYIEWVALVTEDRLERVSLNPGDDPRVTFSYRENAVIYAYCNLHGLWKTSM